MNHNKKIDKSDVSFENTTASVMPRTASITVHEEEQSDETPAFVKSPSTSSGTKPQIDPVTEKSPLIPEANTIRELLVAANIPD